MLAAALAVVKMYNPTTLYTFSDELTLIFPTWEPKAQTFVCPKTPPISRQGQKEKVEEKTKSLLFAHKVTKLVSLSAGLASSSFIISLLQQDLSEEVKKATLKQT
jgi:tRNA(His) 5'-end guanylyltransferase